MSLSWNEGKRSRHNRGYLDMGCEISASLYPDMGNSNNSDSCPQYQCDEVSASQLPGQFTTSFRSPIQSHVLYASNSHVLICPVTDLKTVIFY